MERWFRLAKQMNRNKKSRLVSGISSIIIQLFLCEYSTYPSVFLIVTTILLYIICIRYYFEPIHNCHMPPYGVPLVVYDMYKILFWAYSQLCGSPHPEARVVYDMYKILFWAYSQLRRRLWRARMVVYDMYKILFWASKSKTTLCAANIRCFSQTTKTFHFFRTPPNSRAVRNWSGQYYQG